MVTLANRLMRSGAFDVVVATQDWHPRKHKSFASNNPGKKPGQYIQLSGVRQILWPDHCVQGSRGARFHPRLELRRIDRVFAKGTDANYDSYSGFYDNGYSASTGMGEWLVRRGVTDVAVMGLATDFCVRFTACDALLFGFATSVITDACRGVNMHAEDSRQALSAMGKAGVRRCKCASFGVSADAGASSASESATDDRNADSRAQAGR